MASNYEHEFENESALEGEEFLGSIGSALSGLLGESEGEDEFEAALGEAEASHESLELEDEFEGEDEFEALGEDEAEDELSLHEFEDEGEQFFKKAFRGIAKFAKKAAPILKKVAKVAVPMVASAVGGPLGGVLGKVAGAALGEHELEDEFEGEFESHELEVSPELESELEAMPESHHELMAELMGAVASQAQTEQEAEAMIGAATASLMLSRGDRRALRQVLPHMVRGVSILTRVLRGRRSTRPAVRAVPTIVRRATSVLARRARSGRPVPRRLAGKVLANQTRRVLGSPARCARAMANNVRATRVARRSGSRVVRG